jgi:hypothetical protein
MSNTISTGTVKRKHGAVNRIMPSASITARTCASWAWGRPATGRGRGARRARVLRWVIPAARRSRGWGSLPATCCFACPVTRSMSRTLGFEYDCVSSPTFGQFQDMRGVRYRMCYVVVAMVMGTLWGEVPELHAQSFFGIPLFEGDAKKDAPPKTAPAQKEPPLEEWPLELSVSWAEYKKSRAEGLAKVNGEYISALQEIKKAYTAADKLEDAIRTKREIERVEKENLALEGGGELPALDSRSGGTALPANALRAYRYQMEMKARGLTILNERYAKSVSELKTKLTVADELGGALAAKRIVEVLAQENAAFETLDLLQKDGADKSKSGLAKITPTVGVTSVNELKSNAKAWANRTYRWMNVPVGLPVRRFAMIPGGSKRDVAAKVEEMGYAYIAFSKKNEPKLTSKGWQLTDYAFSYTDKGSSPMYVYSKKVGKGALKIPNLGWAGPVLLLP